MKFCKDCKHVRPWGNSFEVFLAFILRVGRYEDAKCAKTEEAGPLDLVTGDESYSEMEHCGDTRRTLGICGPEAKLFEAKP